MSSAEKLFEQDSGDEAETSFEIEGVSLPAATQK
jgi:hypothetical protein